MLNEKPCAGEPTRKFYNHCRIVNCRIVRRRDLQGAIAGGALALALSPAHAAAQSPSSVQVIDRPREEIVVSATRSPRAGDEVGSSVTVIEAPELALRQYSFVADALRDAPGVALARNGGFGGFASVRVRGATSGQTLVVIDGVVVNDPAAPQGGFNFANLDLVDIERIEILRGPQGILYGADAIGGVISITTRSVLPHRAEAFIEGGSLGAVRGGATFSAANDAGAFARATVSGIRTTGISRADGGAERDGFRSIAGSVRAGLKLGNVWRAEATGRISDSLADIDGFPPPDFTLGDTLETEDTRDVTASGALRHATSDVSGAFTIGYSKTNRRNDDSGFETFAARADRVSADYLFTARVNDLLRLSGGAELERTSVIVSGVDTDARNAAVFALAELEPIKRLTISAGGRRDEFSNFEGATTARFAAAYSGLEGYVFRASWGQGFRAPSLFELNFEQFGVVPNPDLRPERSAGYDVGVERRFDDASGNAIVTARAAFFQTRVRDQIDFDFARSGYFNIDRTRARGVEAEVEWRPTASISASLVYTFTDAVDLDTGAALLRQPKHKGTAVTSWAPTSRLTLSSSVIFNGREADFPAPNDSFVRLDLRGAYRLNETLELYARVENVTDADYQDVSGFGEPGASAFGGVRIKL